MIGILRKKEGKNELLTYKDKIDVLFSIYRYQVEMSKFYDQKAIIILSVNAGIMAATLWKLFEFISASNESIGFFIKFLFLFEIIIFIGTLIFTFLVLFPQSKRSELNNDSIIFFRSLAQIDTKERIRQLIIPKLNNFEDLIEDLSFQASAVANVVSKKDNHTKNLYFLTLINIIFISILFIFWIIKVFSS
ncbi:hypothetical protein [Persephonella sp. IF05-L8]|uniref:hypothetical protein n=1 Tax=Persephonella sp. IF05-L8 TaxID=1158338 RepID=UPI0004963761